MSIKSDLSEDNLNENSGILIGGFKAIGKSTLSKKYSNVIDLESSNFEYIIDENIKNIPVEQRKGLKNRIKNPEYPLNYYNELISNKKRNNEEFVSRVKEVYYADFPKDFEKVIWLQKGQYLEDVLIKKGIIDINSIKKY